MKPGILGICLTCCNLLFASSQEDLSLLIKGQRQFAFSLYNQANPSNEDFLFSPYSIASSLSMVYLGSRGNSQSQMEKALQLEIDSKNLAKATALLNDLLVPKPGNKESYRLINANSLWVDQEIFLLTDFVANRASTPAFEVWVLTTSGFWDLIIFRI